MPIFIGCSCKRDVVLKDSKAVGDVSTFQYQPQLTGVEETKITD